jgi:hypothetical protein
MFGFKVNSVCVVLTYSTRDMDHDFFKSLGVKK